MSYSDGFSSWTAAIVVSVAGERWDANNVGKIEYYGVLLLYKKTRKCHIGYGQHL